MAYSLKLSLIVLINVSNLLYWRSLAALHFLEGIEFLQPAEQWISMQIEKSQECSWFSTQKGSTSFFWKTALIKLCKAKAQRNASYGTINSEEQSSVLWRRLSTITQVYQHLCHYNCYVCPEQIAAPWPILRDIVEVSFASSSPFFFIILIISYNQYCRHHADIE